MRIVKLLDEKSKVLEASRLEMLESLCVKGEDDKPLMKKVMVQRDPQFPPKLEMQYDISEENLAKYNEEFTAMMKEDCDVEVPDILRNDLSIFKGLLANSQAKNLTDSDIVVIEEILEILHSDDEKSSTEQGSPSPFPTKVPKK